METTNVTQTHGLGDIMQLFVSKVNNWKLTLTLKKQVTTEYYLTILFLKGILHIYSLELQISLSETIFLQITLKKKKKLQYLFT